MKQCTHWLSGAGDACFKSGFGLGGVITIAACISNDWVLNAENCAFEPGSTNRNDSGSYVGSARASVARLVMTPYFQITMPRKAVGDPPTCDPGIVTHLEY